MHATRFAKMTAGAVLVLALAGCGSGAPAVMPDVVGKQLDEAQLDIQEAGFGDDVEVVGGGIFGVLDESNWVVCEQHPAAAESITTPRLSVDRECEATDDVVESSEDPVEATEEPTVQPPVATTPATVVDTSVDELLDRLNSRDMGGIEVGDQFRFTGELVSSEYWYSGSAGDYSVLFSAHGGADDLMVIVEESDAAGWADGMRLEVVVENVELDLEGEITDGWLRMLSAAPAS